MSLDRTTSTSALQPVPIGSLKHDPAWKHCQMFKNGDKVQLKCLYCFKLFSGGGIHRIKEHLACQKGNASCCAKVPDEVRHAMLQSLEVVLVKKRNKQKLAQDNSNTNTNTSPTTPITPDTHTSNDGDGNGNGNGNGNGLLLVARPSTSENTLDRRKRARVDHNDNDDYNAGALVPRKDKDNMHLAIARFIYDVGLSLDAVNSPYFQPMINAIVESGPGFEGPSYHDVRGWMLKNSLDEMNDVLDSYRVAWGRTGCSVLVDECTTAGRTFVNTFVYCSEGTMFLRSFDVSESIQSADIIYDVLKGVVEEVGVGNVLQVITEAAEHYAVAGRRLVETFRTLYWTPCASHSINLMLKDIGEVDWINGTLENAIAVTRFVYNHGTVLDIMRRHTCGMDLIQPMITRFATDFITLKCMLQLKDRLQFMVNSQEWMDCPLSKHPEGISMMDIILSQSFWSSCSSVIRLTDPLVGVLRSVGSGKRPTLGYILAAMHHVKETMKSEFLEDRAYMTYWNIIDGRWDQQVQHPLHEAGFFLNPGLYYSLEGDVRDKIPSGMLDCIERLVPEINIQDKINKELIQYKNAVGDFGRKMAIRAAQTLLPAEWWSAYGGGCPNLARLAFRILGQTCSASICRIGSGAFEQLHRTKNHLERQRLSDLLFVQYNLRLQRMMDKEPRVLDPMSTDNIELAEDWVTEKNEVFGNGDSNWSTLHPPVANNMLLEDINYGPEVLVAGFDYQERPERFQDEEDDVGRH